MNRNIAPVKPWITRRPSGVWVGTRNTAGDVGNKLLLQQQTEKELTIPDIEVEIECPRCYDIMALSSDFDRLYSLCEECNLSLSITSRAVRLHKLCDYNMIIVDHIVLYRHHIIDVYAFSSSF